MKIFIAVTVALLLFCEPVFTRRPPVISDEDPTTAKPKRITTVQPSTTSQKSTQKPSIVSTTTQKATSSKPRPTTQKLTTQSSQVTAMTREALKKLIMDYINLRYRESYISKVYCNYEFSEKQLQNYELCGQKGYQKAEWFTRCERQVYGKKWTYKIKRFMHCNKPEVARNKWFECIRGENERNRYEVVNTSNTGYNRNTNRSLRRSKRSLAIQINLESQEQWDRIPMETKKRIFEILRRRYNLLKQEVDCMQNALGINGN